MAEAASLLRTSCLQAGNSASWRGNTNCSRVIKVPRIASLRVSQSAPCRRIAAAPCYAAQRCSSYTAGQFFQGDFGSLTGCIRSQTSGRKPVEGKKGVRAADDIPDSLAFPPMMTKPQWYWRIFALTPYILPLMQGWVSAETAYTLHTLVELYEYHTLPILLLIGRIPQWAMIGYFLGSYMLLVRSNRWPHFLRFHFITGMLLDILMQVFGTINEWLPPSLYWGKIGQHFWLAAVIAFIFTVCDCMVCALRGTYADVPFVSEAAYMQIPYE